MSGQTCSFTSGGTTISAFCENGCCDNACCGGDDTDATLVAIIVASVIGGLIIILLIALLIYCCMKNRNQDDLDDDDNESRVKPVEYTDKSVLTQTYTGEADKAILANLESGNIEKEEKKRTIFVTNKIQPRKSPWDLQGRRINATGEKARTTQTTTPKAMPGDVILWSRGRWVPARPRKFPSQTIADVNKSDKCVGTTETDDMLSNGDEKTIPQNIVLPSDKDEVSDVQNKSTGTPAPVSTRSEGQQYGSSHIYTRRDSLRSSDEELDKLASNSTAPQDTRDSRPDVNSRLRDPNREERDRLKLQDYVASWQVAQKRNWVPHSKKSKV